MSFSASESRSTGSYGAGLLRFMQQAKVVVLEVTTPDKQDRRRRGKNDDRPERGPCRPCRPADRDAEKRDSMIRSLRSTVNCRKTAVSARRIALQMIHNTIVCAPDALRDQLRNLTRVQLVQLASWRPDLTAYRDLDSAYRIGLKSLARRYLELHDEIADLDVMIAAIVNELAEPGRPTGRSATSEPPSFSLTAGDNLKTAVRSQLRIAVRRQRFRHRREKRSATGSSAAEIAPQTAHYTSSPSRTRTDRRAKDYVARRIAEGRSNSTPFER